MPYNALTFNEITCMSLHCMSFALHVICIACHLHYMPLHYITLHYITLHYIACHCIACHCIACHGIWLAQATNLIVFVMCQSHFTSCQIRNIFARHVSKVKVRYVNINKYSTFAYFEMIQQLKHILQ